MNQMMVRVADLEVFCHFFIRKRLGDQALMMGFFHRSAAKVRGVAANLGSRSGKLSYRSFHTQLNGKDDAKWTGIFRSVDMGMDRFLYCFASTNEFGSRYLATTADSYNEDCYNFLMHNYKLPLLKEWTPAIMEQLLKERKLCKEPLDITTCSDEPVRIPINGTEVDVKDLQIYDFQGLSNDTFTEVVSGLLRRKVICITPKRMNPLTVESFDDYIKKYGQSMADNLNARMEPLAPLKANVEELALKHKSLYPQQAACVNGIIQMRKNGLHYAVLNEGMGVGKTLQSLGAMEGAKVEEWLRKNPDKTLRDAYLEPDTICYRAVIVCPGHLVEKWKEEILYEIPYATVTSVQSLEDFVAIKEKGRMPYGREFYIVSKDKAKLDTIQTPTPAVVRKKKFNLAVCRTCLEDGKIFYKKGKYEEGECPACKGHEFVPMPVSEKLYTGLVCPDCGELLIQNKGYNPNAPDFDEKLGGYVLTPVSFTSANKSNSRCYHCGCALWGGNAKPLVQFEGKQHRSKWKKISHFTNYARKGRTTAFVLKGWEDSYKSTITTSDGWKESEEGAYGPRRTAPAHYIKTHLKGYFDFCVLDEAHKYFGDSSQSVAAHNIVKASKFTLALTGTISNGTASSFYHLFWMLEPSRMIAEGYGYSKSELDRFCKQYGCVETTYECASVDNSKGGIMTRGKRLGEPRVKAGISPVIFGKFLMDRCLFLDITDLSKYLPKFSERVRLVPLPTDIIWDYNHVMDTLKQESQKGSGMGVLSTMLQFGMSYPDKPYARNPIMDPYRDDCILVKPRNFEEYADIDFLTPKEKALMDIIRAEQAEGRNCFVYATFTGKPETSVSERLKALIEYHCNLQGQVEIIQSESPSASKREAWFHKRASEGIRVFIANPKNVETGLDFCFKHEGAEYNYPTLIFYQTGYELATIWQASRRAYRLNQKKECRNYYLAYEGTLQAAALEIMAKKQQATAAIQGHFSTEGLSAMANGVDTRTQLAEALAKNNMSSRETLENMFDALGQEYTGESDGYDGFKPSPSFFEVIGACEKDDDEFFLSFTSFEKEEDNLFDEVMDNTSVTREPSAARDIFDDFFDLLENSVSKQEVIQSVTVKKKTSRKATCMAGTMDIFSILEAV